MDHSVYLAIKMAEQALDKQSNCAICLDTYTDPRLLQCFHVYCRKCIVKGAVRDQQGQLILTCPTCHKVTSIPENEVSGLQSANHINCFLKLGNSFRNLKGLTAVKEMVGDKATTDIIPKERAIIKCSEHTDRDLELYCLKCEEVICLKCMLKGSRHQGHDSITLDEAFDKYQGEITSSLEPMEKQLTIMKSALAQLDTRCEEISNQRAAIEDDIHKSFRHLHEILDARKTKVISELHQMTEGKLKGLATQRDLIETTQAQLNSCLNLTRASLKKSYQAAILIMKNTITKQVEELAATYCQPDALKPNTEADLTFSVLSDVRALCKNYGKITQAPADPSKCYVRDMREVARIGENIAVLLEAITFSDKPCKQPIKLLECELVSEISGTMVKGSVERRGENQYQISYQPSMKGRHQLHVKVEGHHIRGSPFTLAVTAPVEMLGSPMQSISIELPMGVAILQNGEVLVSTHALHCVSIFSPSGKKLWSFGTRGSDQGQFDCPSDVAVDGEGNILVADVNNHRIQMFTAGGHFLRAVGIEGHGLLQFKYPSGIAFNASNNKVYVTDKLNHRIQVLNSDLTFSSTCGKYGSGRGEFNEPCSIACDSSGNVYVADRNNRRIQIFTAEGKYLKMFHMCGYWWSRDIPDGVAVDASGDRVYVSEWENNRVSVFTSEGQFLTSFGKQGDGPGEFKCPYGLTVDSSGVVYVCDHLNGSVKMF